MSNLSNWLRTKFGNIGPIMPTVSSRAFRALAKVSYWGRIKEKKLKDWPVFMITVPWLPHETVWNCMSLQRNILALLLIDKNVEMLHFHILTTLDLGRHWAFEKLVIVWGHRAVTTGPKHMIFHIFKESILTSLLLHEILQNSTSCGFTAFRKRIL